GGALRHPRPPRPGERAVLPAGPGRRAADGLRRAAARGTARAGDPVRLRRGPGRGPAGRRDPRLHRGPAVRRHRRRHLQRGPAAGGRGGAGDARVPPGVGRGRRAGRCAGHRRPGRAAQPVRLLRLRVTAGVWPLTLDDYPDRAITGTLHHVEIWVPDLDRAVASWGWLLPALGYAPFQHWTAGRSWRLGYTYVARERAPDLPGT